MIFDWKDEFSEELYLNGIDLEDDVKYLDRSINLLSGCVVEGEDEYWVYIEIGKDFKIKSLECDCKKDKCHHMTALLHANNFSFSKDIEYEELIDYIDHDKLIKFIKDQLDYNEECREDFIDEFKGDLVNDDELPLDEKLFLIMDSYNWEDFLTDFVKKDLVKLYDDAEYEGTFFLISLMFSNVLSDITYNPSTKLKECYAIIVDLLIKLSKTNPELIKEFLRYCINHNYLNLYPKFSKLNKRLSDSLK